MNGKLIAFVVVAFIIGFIVADYIGQHFAKVHGYTKRGGIFQG